MDMDKLLGIVEQLVHIQCATHIERGNGCPTGPLGMPGYSSDTAGYTEAELWGHVACFCNQIANDARTRINQLRAAQ